MFSVITIERIMSLFKQHIPCPKCGSKDNLADYTDHQYCFGCQYYKKKDDLNSLRERLRTRTVVNTSYGIPVVDKIPQEAMQWLLKYDIRQDEIDKYKIKWSPLEILILMMTKSYWQGRNFGFGNQKYKSNGIKPLTKYGKGGILILVEDVLSAIKIARTDDYSGVPLLGSSLSKEHEQRLKKHKTVYVWLDRDKAKNAVRIKNRLRELGITSKAIITELDPKCYNKTEINKWLKN